MHSDVAISVKNLTKTYRIFGHPGDRIKQALTFGQKQYHKEFTALKDVSFEIKKGETVGIIGRNGSGKSTLLQLICGILKPTTGSVEVNGRISALLELGAGFNPEFTGRENVYFQGAVMGIVREEMAKRFDEIAAFADIGEFVDQPVRTYSSGMFVRLAFASAVHVSPEVLVIDEALAVGDQEFQAKCLGRIDAIKQQGGTVIMVSHALEQLAHHCSSAIFIDRGRLIFSGDTTSVLAAYLRSCEEHGSDRTHPARKADVANAGDLLVGHPWYSPKETRWGDGKAAIQNVRILQDGIEPQSYLKLAQPTAIEVDVLFLEQVDAPIFGLTIKSMNGAILYSVNSRQLGTSIDFCQAGARARAAFKLVPCLDCGNYMLSVGVASDLGQVLQAHDRRYDVLSLRIDAPRDTSGYLDMQSAFTLVVEA